MTSPTRFSPIAYAGQSELSLSPDGLTATIASSPETRAVGDNPLGQGSYYFEITLVAFNTSSGDVLVGLQQDPYAGDGAYAVGAFCVNSGGFVFCDGADPPPASVGAMAVGDVIGVAVSLPNLGWIRRNNGPWNGAMNGDPATGVGGVSLAAMPPLFVPLAWCQSGGSGTFKINAGQAAFVNAPPALFGDWPGGETLTLTSATTVGNTVHLAGTTNNGVAQALDYSIDGGRTWTACTNYAAAANWTSDGPTLTYPAQRMIMVRDHATGAQSAALPFSVKGSYSGALVFSDDFESYTPGNGSVASMQAAGWTFDQLQLGATSPVIGTPTGLFGQWLRLDWQDSQGNPASFRVAARHAFKPLLQGRLAFDCQLSTNNGSYFQTVLIDDGNDNTVVEMLFNYTGSGQYELSILPKAAYPTAFDPGLHHIEIDFQIVPGSPNTVTTTLVVDGVALAPVYTFPLNAAQASSFRFFNDVGCNLDVDNVVVYDTTAPAEALTITSANGYGGPVRLAGSNTGPPAAAMDYLLDGGAQWQPLTSFTSGSAWSGTGPVVASGTHTIEVRDDANQSVVSNTYTFTVGAGIFLWDGVRLH